MTPFTVIGTSDFNLYNRWFSGEDIEPVLAQRHDLGFNSLRVWTAYDLPLIGTCDPHRSGFYTHLPDFMEVIADYDLYAEITAFTGPYPYFLNQAQMIDHWDNLSAVLAPCTNLLDLEAINEGDNGPNLGVPLNLLRQPPSPLLSSHGSSIQDAPPQQPHWSVAGYRAPSLEWQRKVGHNAMEWAVTWSIPVYTNEYPRVDLDPNPDHWFDGAASSVLLCAGAGMFHSAHGKDSTLFQPGQELDCATAFVAGARSVPLEYQTGQYSVNNPPYPPGVIRIYERRLADGRSKQVPVRG